MTSYTLARAPSARTAVATTTNANTNNNNNPNANLQNPSARAMAAEPNRNYNNNNNSPYSGEDTPDEDLDDENAALRSQALNADGTPKRPMNAFMIFARRRRPQVSAQNQMMRTGEISKILSREWISMSGSEKHFYQDQAKKLKETFNMKYPDYVYRRRPNNTRKKRRMDAAPYDLSASPHEYTEDYGSLSPVDGPPYRLPYGGIDGAYYSHGHARQFTEPIPAMNPTLPAPAPAPVPVPVYGADHYHHQHPHHAHPADDHFSSQPPQPQQQWHPASYPPLSKTASHRNNFGGRNGAGHRGGGAGHAVASAAAVTHGGAGAAGGGAGVGPGSLGGMHGSAGSYDSQLRLGARRGMIPPPINANSHHNYHGHHGTNGHGHGHYAAQQQQHHPRHWSDDTGSSVSPPSSAGSAGFPPGFGCGPGNGGNGYGTLNGTNGSGHAGGNPASAGAGNGFGALTAPFFPSTSPSTSSVSTTSSSGGPTAGTTSAAPGGYYAHTRGGAAPDTYDSHLHSAQTVSHHPHHTPSTTRQSYGHSPPQVAPTLSLSPTANGTLWGGMRPKPEL